MNTWIQRTPCTSKHARTHARAHTCVRIVREWTVTPLKVTGPVIKQTESFGDTDLVRSKTEKVSAFGLHRACGKETCVAASDSHRIGPLSGCGRYESAQVSPRLAEGTL